MDKIDFTAASLINPSLQPNLKKTKPKEAQKGGKTIFAKLLDSSTPQAGESSPLGPLREIPPSEEALTSLMDAVHSAGSDLLDRPFSDEILRYKKAVRDFIHYIIENSIEVEKMDGLKKKIVVRGETRWTPVVHHQIRVIDQKLEELAAAILSGQTTQLQRVSKLDEIKGLLVDLTIQGVIRESYE